MNVWKERNKKILKEEKSASLSLVELIIKQLKEIMGTTVRNLPKSSLSWRVENPPAVRIVGAYSSRSRQDSKHERKGGGILASSP